MNAQNTFPLSPWAYTGTDDTDGVQCYPFTSGNSLPALVVWLILTTNTQSAANIIKDADSLKQIANSVNLTTTCVSAILSQFSSATETVAAGDVTDAFETVGDSFHLIGGPGGYPPDECPYLSDILTLASSLKNVVPQSAAPQKETA